MLAAVLIGLPAGQRALTPLAAVAIAAARGQLPADTGAPALLARPLAAGGALVLAALEMAGDKMASAPDRVAPAGLAARLLAAGLAGAALVPRRQRWLGAAAAATTAVVASYPGWRARLATMPRFGRVATGFAEDAAVLAATVAVVRAA